METGLLQKKITLSDYPEAFRSRLIPAFGESLPFKDDTFDLATSYQTLEHVRSVEQCISEMLRVVKPGGSLFIRAPDYTSFYEAHYRLFFLPLMPKLLAKCYLRLMMRPLAGLETINYVTSRGLAKTLEMNSQTLLVEKIMEKEWRGSLIDRFPRLKFNSGLLKGALLFLKFKYGLLCFLTCREQNILLWVKKRK